MANSEQSHLQHSWRIGKYRILDLHGTNNNKLLHSVATEPSCIATVIAQIKEQHNVQEMNEAVDNGATTMKHTCLNIFSLCLSFLGFLRPIGGFLSLLPVIRSTSTSVS